MVTLGTDTQCKKGKVLFRFGKCYTGKVSLRQQLFQSKSILFIRVSTLLCEDVTDVYVEIFVCSFCMHYIRRSDLFKYSKMWHCLR